MDLQHVIATFTQDQRSARGQMKSFAKHARETGDVKYDEWASAWGQAYLFYSALLQRLRPLVRVSPEKRESGLCLLLQNLGEFIARTKNPYDQLFLQEIARTIKQAKDAPLLVEIA